MRCELMQMDRMAPDERFGEQAGETMRRNSDIRRRMRREYMMMMEEERHEHLSDQCAD